MNNPIRLWFHVNKSIIVTLTVFLLIGLLYFPLSMLTSNEKLVSGVVSGRGFNATGTGSKSFIQIKLKSGLSVNISGTQHILLKSGDEVCLNRIERLFIGTPEYVFRYVGNCT
ncbi:hypothetical protein CYQ91_22940 [Vibrio diabolicus]|uniref:Uncharacterized protein n=1 Tax=Vibrio diabolicus TaxID=50719 RepID=A0AAX1XGZ4_9VIBR|nr:hypothetical protein CYQ91_22940 [Vibrio diabolicus]